MTPHTAFGIRLIDGLIKAPVLRRCIACLAERTALLHARSSIKVDAVSFCHGQNPILGRGLIGNWIFRGRTGRGLPKELHVLEWDAANLLIPNHAAANALLTRAYRPGWEVPPAQTA